MPQQGNLPPLEQRFLPPPGWRWHTFRNAQGKTLRFGCVTPAGEKPDAVVVCLQGLREFTEKYFEVANDMLSRNVGFWMLDWQGQGKSDRYLKNPHKRHSHSFDDDIADLHQFITRYVRPAAVRPDAGRIPLVMVAHSMGANIGLRYLDKHPDTFAAAALSAPMLGIQALKHFPPAASLALTGACSAAMGKSYVMGGRNWFEGERGTPGQSDYSSDPVRDALNDIWCKFDPALQTGHVTYGWVHQANVSCARLRDPETLKHITIPCVMATAGQETLVDNDATWAALKIMPNSKLLEFLDAKHEILMERDDIRNRFLQAFDQMLADHNIKGKLKPF